MEHVAMKEPSRVVFARNTQRSEFARGCREPRNTLLSLSFVLVVSTGKRFASCNCFLVTWVARNGQNARRVDSMDMTVAQRQSNREGKKTEIASFTG
jgi:hypothetical protein